MSLNWDAVIAFGLTLPDVEFSSHYGAPALKTNGRAFLSPSREAGSFCLHIGKDMVEMLMETDPDTYWQTPHYVGWAGLLVRYDTPDPERVLATIRYARDWAASQPKPRPRTRKA
jgi:hypothetical protein